MSRKQGKPIRVCLLSYRGNPRSGGQGVYVARLSAALADLGHQVTVLSGPPYPELDSRVQLEKIPGLNLFDGRDKLSAFRRSWLLSPLALCEWLSALAGGFPEPWSFGKRALAWLNNRVGDFDVVHDNQSLCSALLSIQRRVPLVVTLHHPITRDREVQLRFARDWKHRLFIRRWYSFLPMQKRVAPRLRRLIAPSASSRSDMASDFAIDPARVAVVPQGVDLRVFRPLEGISRKPLQLMTTTSADVPLKGLDTLLMALKLLREKVEGVELIVVGRPRKGGHTERTVQSLGIGRAVRFVAVDGAEQIAELYATASVAVLPSLYEGFGIPAIEAMACAVPLVVTDGGALPEVVGEAGLTVPKENPQAMADAIERLLKDEKLRSRLGRAGQKRSETFSWQRAAADTAEQYRLAIAEFDRGQASC